ncbi:MAG: ABC transporter substrate-binding protein [Dictyoglomaceae bacterium]
MIIQKLAEEFMKRYPSIEIKTEFIPEADYSNKLIAALAAGIGPNVIQIEAGTVKQFVAKGVLQPLDPKVVPPATIERDFVASTIEPLKWKDGKYYGLPTDVQTIVLFYNKDLFKEVGLDPEKPPLKTWDQVITAAKKIVKFGPDGKMVRGGLGISSYHPYISSIFVAAGAPIVDETGKFIFNNPKAVEAFQFWIDLERVHKVWDSTFMSRWTAFRQGKLGMVPAHPAMAGNFKVTAPNIKFGVVEMPKWKTDKTSTVTSWAYCMTKRAPSEAATKWINFITSYEAEKLFTKETGELPARKSLLIYGPFLKDPLLKPMLDSLKHSVTSPWQFPEAGGIIADAWNRVMKNNVPVKEALDKAVEEMNKVVAEKYAVQ